MSIGQNPKLEDFEKYLFIVLKAIAYNQNSKTIEIEQQSFIIGPNYVISFQETEGDTFENIRDRIRSAKGKIRKMGADYLVHGLMDSIIDNYFTILSVMGEEIEVIEEQLVKDPEPEVLSQINALKRNLIFLRKSVWPLREVISGMQRNDSKLIKTTTMAYLRDIYDHTIQVIDTIETFRDMASGMVDVYLSSLSNRTNDVMKVLTIIATIFIPLTFITGLYGMNFDFIPELHAFAWGIMIVISAVMLIYFRKRKWI